MGRGVCRELEAGGEGEKVLSNQAKVWNGRPTEKRGGDTAGQQEKEKSDWLAPVLPQKTIQAPLCGRDFSI